MNWDELALEEGWTRAEGRPHARRVLRRVLGRAFLERAIEDALSSDSTGAFAAGAVASFLLGATDVQALRERYRESSESKRVRIVEVLRFSDCEEVTAALVDICMANDFDRGLNAALFALMNEYRRGRLEDEDVRRLGAVAGRHRAASWVVEELSSDSSRKSVPSTR